MAAQDFQDFEAIVIHERSAKYKDAESVVASLGDNRFRFVYYPHRMEDWGNTIKECGTKEHATGRFVGHTNGDNYFTPAYLSRMLYPLVMDTADFTYCDHVSHHYDYAVRPEVDPLGRYLMDGSGWVCRREIVVATPFTEKERQFADGAYAKKLAQKCRITKVPGVLWVHV